MQRLEGIELIVFDLDGTLVNSQYDLTDAVNFALFRMAKPQLPYEEIPSKLGGGVRSLISQAFGTDVKEEIDEALVFFYEFYEKNHTAKTDYYPGVRGTLQKLTNKIMAVLSNKPQRFTEGIMSKLDTEGYFDLVFGAQPDIYGLKPSPEGLQKILHKFNVAAVNAVMVGDSTHDIMAAKSIGMKTCAVTYGYRNQEMLAAEEPDVMIDTFADLVKVIE